MTSHYQSNSEFALPFLRGVAAKAADTRPSLLQVSAATFNDDQHGSTHERGRGVPELGMLSRASIPADGRWACRAVANLRRLPLYDVPRKLGRSLIGSGPFGRPSGCVNTQLAKPINHPLGDSSLKNFAKGPEHSKISDLLRPNRSNAGGQRIGTSIQGRN